MRISSYPSRTGLVKTLKDASGPMYTFYLLLKDRTASEPISCEEIDIASGKTAIDSGKSAEFVAKLKEKTENIQRAFNRQQEAATVSQSSQGMDVAAYSHPIVGALESSKI